MKAFPACAAVVVLASRIALAQTPAAPPQGPAAVEGAVVLAGTSQPVAGVRVHLSSDFRREPGAPRIEAPDERWYSATTGQDGRFAFENVKPGKYRLLAERDGYLPGEFGQRSPTSPGAGFALEPGQRLRDAQLAITQTGSISGRLSDRDGPAGSVQVQALTPRYRDGKRTLSIVQSVLSNDRGEYRLFWLPPGGYYVAARPANADAPLSPVVIQQPSRGGGFEEARPPVVSTRTLPNGELLEETFLPVYYPGTTRLDVAARIDLRAGADVDGLDFSLAEASVRTRHIRGVVITALNGQPSADATVMAVPRTSEPSVAIPSARAGADGTFDLAGVVPGSYYLLADNRGTANAVVLQVGDTDVNNITLSVAPGFMVNGRFVFDGRSRDGANPLAPPRPEGQASPFPRVELRREPDVVGMPMSGPTFSPPPSADGSFVLQGVMPGDFQASVRSLSPDAYVKSMRLGSADVLDGGLHLTGPPRESLEVVIALNAGRLNGTVVNARQEPVSNASVAVVPDTDRHRADLYKRAASDSEGRFAVRGLAAGSYRVFAWDVVEEGAWQDPEFIRAYESRGTAVRLRDGSDENIQLTVIR